MPKRTEELKNLKKSEYEYMLFVWNGKTANPIIKVFIYRLSSYIYIYIEDIIFIIIIVFCII